MNNPFHRAAVKAFSELVKKISLHTNIQIAQGVESGAWVREFEAKLEAAAKAFDSCKRGTEISMTALQHEQQHALSAFAKRLKLDGDYMSACRAFNEHMKPHFEIRLW